MTFVSTSIAPDGSDYELTGDLTIKGVTKPVTFDLEFEGVVTDPWGNTKAGFSAETEINRKEWGLDYNVGARGRRRAHRREGQAELEIEAAQGRLTPVDADVSSSPPGQSTGSSIARRAPTSSG